MNTVMAFANCLSGIVNVVMKQTLYQDQVQSISARHKLHTFSQSKKENKLQILREEKYVVDPRYTKTKLVFTTLLICFTYLVGAFYLSLNLCARLPQATLLGKMATVGKMGP